MNSDLIVVGGGTAGVMAALAAASRGIKVTIIEQQSTCGGNATLSGLAEFNAVTFKKRLTIKVLKKRYLIVSLNGIQVNIITNYQCLPTKVYE